MMLFLIRRANYYNFIYFIIGAINTYFYFTIMLITKENSRKIEILQVRSGYNLKKKKINPVIGSDETCKLL